MPGPRREARSSGTRITAQVTRIQRELEELISKLADDERAALTAYERETPALQGQVRSNEQKMQQLRRENKTAQDTITQLRGAWEAAREERRRVQGMFGRARENTIPPEMLPPLTAAGIADAGPATSQQRDEEPPVTQSETRRSTRDRRAPRRFSLSPTPHKLRVPSASPLCRGTPADKPASAAGKRKRDGDDKPGSGQQKQKRKFVAQAEEAELASAAQKQPNGVKGKQVKTINFNEVFQDGNAEYKHRIIEYPVYSGHWYILRCDEHYMHFGHSTLLIQAFRHLHSKSHGSQPQGTATAVRELGICVQNCDASKAAQNNAAFAAALKRGYKVLKGKPSLKEFVSRRRPAAALRVTHERGRSGDDDNSEGEEAATQRIRSRSRPFNGITNPVAGELYLGRWRSRWHAAIMLPIGNLETVGISGSIYDTRLIKRHIPMCYARDSARTILGYAEGFEDGGPDAKNRRFPVMYFDDDQDVTYSDDDQHMSLESGLVVPPSDSLAWIRASLLRPFSAYDPNNLPPRGYDVALEFAQRRGPLSAAKSVLADVSAHPRDPTTGETHQAESSISHEKGKTSNIDPATLGRTDKEGTATAAVGEGSRPTSSGPRIAWGIANRSFANQSWEEDMADASEDPCDDAESGSDSDDESGSEYSNHASDPENRAPQSDQANVDTLETPELHPESDTELPGMADYTEQPDNSATREHVRRSKSVDVSFDFAPNFHMVLGTDHSSQDGDTTESDTDNQAQKISRQTEGSQNARTSPSRSIADTLPVVRETLADAHLWLDTSSDGTSENANAPPNSTEHDGASPIQQRSPAESPLLGEPSRPGVDAQNMDHGDSPAADSQAGSFYSTQPGGQPVRAPTWDDIKNR